MDLRKFKILSAVLLAAALLFLSVMLMRGRTELEYLPPSVATDLSTLFAGSGNALPAELVPLKRKQPSVYVCSTASAQSAQLIAEEIGDSKRLAANLTENGYIFRLESGALAEIDRSLYFRFDGSGNGTIPQSVVTYAPTQKAVELASKLTEKLYGRYAGQSVELCNYVLTSAAETGSTIQLQFDLFIGGTPVNGAGATVCIDRNGKVTDAYGNGYFTPLKKQSGTARYDIINVLKKECDTLARDGITGLTVTEVESCYVTTTDVENGTIFFFPGWRISYSDGTAAIYDSVNCEKH